jgi:hypothetical protein
VICTKNVSYFKLHEANIQTLMFVFKFGLLGDYKFFQIKSEKSLNLRKINYNKRISVKREKMQRIEEGQHDKYASGSSESIGDDDDKSANEIICHITIMGVII